ncbi:hypothetical protein HWV62_849 [Athelia sp. TMB]|nr:hypothetical protein HWV62_849 [Athelia sp. TMB]
MAPTKVLEKLLHEWRKDPRNKILIFTKSIKLLNMLAFHVKSKGYGYLQLDGNVPMPRRMPMIDQFHEDPDKTIFLISTMAGGTGLNLTGANKVVIFDPNWNPAYDLQAMDRAYRFGQTRDVEVYRLLGAGSLEELIYARQLYKQQQMAIGYDASIQTRYFEGVQDDKTRRGELFGIQNIFKYHEGSLATKEAIEKANIMELDWAMANMDSKPARASSKKVSKIDEISEIDAKGEADLRGLGAFLFDDVETATSKTRHQDEIQKKLNDIGAYTHLNDVQLRPTGVEEVRYIQASKKRRKSASKKGLDDSEGPKEVVWPPVRKKHRPPPSPGTKLANRQGALIELGMIHSPAHLADFAQDFNRKPQAEQIEILRQLDEYTAKNIDRHARLPTLSAHFQAMNQIPKIKGEINPSSLPPTRPPSPPRLKASLGLPDLSFAQAPIASGLSLSTTPSISTNPTSNPDAASDSPQPPALSNFALDPDSPLPSSQATPASTNLLTPGSAEFNLPHLPPGLKSGSGLSPLIGSLESISDIGTGNDAWDHGAKGADMYVGDHPTDSLGLYSPEEAEPLIGHVLPLSVLRAEYAENPGAFVQQIDFLSGDGYDRIRRTKRNGDCLYTAIVFAFAERALSASAIELAAVREALDATFKAVTEMFDPALLDEITDWYEELLYLLPKPGSKLTVEALAVELQKPEKSNPILVYVRLLTSAELQGNAEEFVHFLPDYDASLDAKGNVRDFCSKHVEPLGTYAGASLESEFGSLASDVCCLVDNLQITALPDHYDILVRSENVRPK